MTLMPGAVRSITSKQSRPQTAWRRMMPIETIRPVRLLCLKRSLYFNVVSAL
jgi:hypothetical protein